MSATEAIADLITRTSALFPKLEINVVTNIEGKTESLMNDVAHGRRARFYLLDEIDEAVATWQNYGATVFVHDSEKAFIARIAEIAQNKSEGTIIYGMADSSVGPGRKSLIPALCDLYGLPYLNSDAFSNAFARHKYLSNVALRSHGLKVPDSWYFLPGEGWLEGHYPQQGTTIIAKPSYDCQSLGITNLSRIVVDSSLERKLNSLAEALKQPLSIQQFIPGYELSVPLLTCPQPESPGVVALEYEGNLDWGQNFRKNEDLFVKGRIRKVAFSELGSDFNSKLIEQAKRAYKIIGFRGTARIDFRVTADKDPFIMDVNEAPSPIRLDQFYVSMEAAGFTFPDMLIAFIGASLSLHPAFKGQL
ncbi:ATP-grasp domain-containing protein [uncultured Cohaesibacter sp.]|uniref:ATP-grasp domain-containing protein n=1 Tax=uncultured Cohaesibacter sp. TaxID=1002546 RepID=UPI0029C79F0A|nr:ATP-grasp domain-containing protein [uncultured Cohaesibacter sp.]